MAEPHHRQLLSQARRLARLDPNRPAQANLRRAVSAAYYALFHFLVDQACIAIVGGAHDRRGFRHVLARAFEHSTMADTCKSFAGGQLPKGVRSRLPRAYQVRPELRRIAHTFRDAQERRYLADYDLAQGLRRAQVLALIRDVEEALENYRRVRAEPDVRFFLACLLAWKSLAGRR
jgi:hypothetical protein